MIPSASFLRFLFKGKALVFWMVLCVLYMAIQPFINRTHPYNTVISSYISYPVITDDAATESAYFAALFVPIHNITVVVLSFSLYTLICAYVIRMKGIVKGTHYKSQVQLFVQALLICTTTAITSLLYVLLGFITLSRSLIIAMNVFWQLSHGLHGFIYFFFNRSIRNEVLGIFGRKKSDHITTVTAR
ncbi:hypothetical protein GCK32_001453 [Trichostrongylus colubriformis]|uniref:7TM GPCR serpentine receptor class x (Srx) domain-containing protein n=1 Tax=Trichostrongylus colubriformis TaxID=6319 RepID=A0AAN8F0Q3_TRICO